MEKLRENYKNGEKLHALDVNKITHNVNVLADGAQVVDKLPEEGETGVIYAVPNKERMYDEYGFGQLGLKDGVVVPTNFGEEDEELGYATLKVGDIVVSYGSDDDSGEPSENDGNILVTSVNRDELKIIFSQEEGVVYVSGVTGYINHQSQHTYKITGVYNVPIQAPEERAWELESYTVTLYTYEEIVSEVFYADYTSEHFPAFNVYITRQSDVASEMSYYYNRYTFPLLRVNELDLGVSEFISLPFFEQQPITVRPEIGDTIRYTGEEYHPDSETSYTIQYVAAISVDEDNLKNGAGGTLNGINGYVGLQTNHCYVVTGKYTIPVGEWMINMAEQESGIKMDGNMTLYTYNEIPFTSNVTYTLETFPGLYWHLEQVDSNIYDEYYWNNGKYEAIGGGSTGGDDEYVTMNYLENNYYSSYDIQNSYYDKADVDVRLEDKADYYHTHSISEVTNLQSTLNDKVTSHKTNGVLDVTTIWKGTQEQYDAIQNKDAHTLYVITEDEGH